MTVLAANTWPTNAHLIADVAALDYLRPTDHVLDPTFGRGTWWNLWRPERLTTHDLRQDGVDFRQLPEQDAMFDAVAFDPPYMAPGGRKTSTLGDFNDRFGTHTAARTPRENQEVINAGLKEMLRVVKGGGVVLVKCCDYVNGGKLFPGTHLTLTAALDLGFRLADRLEHVGKNPRPQPPRQSVRQLHARRNLTLFVLRAPAAPLSRQLALSAEGR